MAPEKRYNGYSEGTKVFMKTQRGRQFVYKLREWLERWDNAKTEEQKKELAETLNSAAMFVVDSIRAAVGRYYNLQAEQAALDLLADRMALVNEPDPAIREIRRNEECAACLKEVQDHKDLGLISPCNISFLQQQSDLGLYARNLLWAFDCFSDGYHPLSPEGQDRKEKYEL